MLVVLEEPRFELILGEDWLALRRGDGQKEKEERETFVDR
jgi:hypothetical protein